MKKSKFLKKSLAALLAILMVAAMIPLSAAAEDAPADPAPDPVEAPVITVNSQYADYNAETKTFSVKVEDTASVDITRSALTGDRANWEVYVVTSTVNPETNERVELKLPTYYLDLTKQAEEINKEDKIYSIPLKMYDETTPAAPVLKDTYTLVVTEDRTVAFDSADLRTVRPNQTWTVGNTETTISAISGDHNNQEETISIVLPLGLTAGKVGLGSNMNDAEARRIFVPESANATVEYFAPTTDQTKATVVVTARDGKTKTFNVTFSYEQSLQNIAIIDRVPTTSTHDSAGTVGEAQGITMDANGDAVIYIPVADNKWLENSHHTTSHFYARFTEGNGLVRVEDPQPNDGPSVDLSIANWAANSAGTGSNRGDEPIVSVNNTIRFVKVDGVWTAWLTVITKANWNEDDSTVNNRQDPGRENVYANVKIVLSAKASGGSGSVTGGAPKLYELQLEGYEAAVNREGWEDGDEIDIYVSNNDYITSGWDIYQKKRISALTTAGATISIPEQSTEVHGPYWQIIPETLATGRLEKNVINNVNIAGHQFYLQITSGGESAIIKVNLKKAAHYVPEMTGFRLYDEVHDTWYEGVQTSYRGDHYVVTLPRTWGTQVPVASRVRGAGDSMELALVWKTANPNVIIGTKNTTYNTQTNKARWAIDFSELTSDADFVAAAESVWTTHAGTTENITAKTSTSFTTDNLLELSIDNVPFAFVDFSSGTENTAAHTVSYDVYAIGDTGKASAFDGKVKIHGVGSMREGAFHVSGSNKILDMSTLNPSTDNFLGYQVTTVATGYQSNNVSEMGDEEESIAEFNTATDTGLTYSCALGYSYEGMPLHSDLQNFKIYADISDGTYATPGGKGFGVQTDIGMNGDANGNGRKETFEFTEIENHITKVSDIWTGSYTVNPDGKQRGTGKMSDYLVLRVTNSENNVDFRDYTIELRPEDSVNDNTPGSTDDTRAELTVGSATTALDNDLVYGGNTISMIAGHTISYIKTTDTPPAAGTGSVTAASTATKVPATAADREDLENDRRFENSTTVYVDADNPTGDETDAHLAETAARLNEAAAYVGAIKEGENSFPIEVKDIPGVAGAKVLEITVPYNYKAKTKPVGASATNPWNDDGQKVYFTGVSKPSTASIVRYQTASSKYQIEGLNLSLNMDIQDQQGSSNPLSFVFTEDEIAKAWNGSAINRDVMSPENVLYVYSQADLANAAGYVTGVTPPTTDTSSTAPGLDEVAGLWDAEDTMPTMIYYVVAKRAPVSKATTLSSFASDKAGVDVSINWSQKIIDVAVPYSWNWGAYREDDSHDFTFNFTIDPKATLIDVMHDTPEVEMKAERSTSVNVSEYEGKRQSVFEWVSSSRTDKPATKFFVRNGLLYTFDPETGDEMQITGLQGNKDEYRNYAHGVITSKDTELRIYDQDKKNINTYKLRVTIKESEGNADINTLKVGETYATLAEDGATYHVDLTDEDLTAMLLEITTVSPLATVEVTTNADGVTAAYDSNNYLTKRWDLSKGATIKVTAEDNNSKTYTLNIGEITPTPTPPVTDEPTPTPTPTPTPPAVDVSKYTDLDILSADVRKEVVQALEAGLVQGVSETRFGVGLNMKRVDYAILVARAKLFESGVTGTTSELDAMIIEQNGTDVPFTDMANVSDIRKAAVAYCLKHGYMTGRTTTTFDYNGNISRQEATVVIARVAGLSNENTDVSMFKDGDKIANYAKGYVRAAYDAGLVNGKTADTFGPTEFILRQHATILLTRNFLKEDENPGDDDNSPGDDDNNGDDDTNTPDEGDTGDDANTPDEGDTGDDANTPDEGDTGDDANTPDEGDTGDDADTPDEGDAGDDATE